MASDTQDTTENVATESQTSSEAGTLGFSNAASVAAIFPQRAVQLGDYDPETKYFTLLNSSVSNGHGFSEDVNLNYANAPDGTISATVVGPPANAYVPNPSSPGGTIGVTNDNPADKPAAPESFVRAEQRQFCRNHGRDVPVYYLPQQRIFISLKPAVAVF